MRAVAIKERPIIFSWPMVRALLEGRKTQTRRIVKVPSYIDADPGPYSDIEECSCEAASYPHLCGIGKVSGCQVCIHCPYGKPGDRLWVRETFRFCDGQHVEFKANTPELESSEWRSPIHMPRRACRLSLEITDVRVERVQNISEEDAHAEGFGVAFGPGMFSRAFDSYWEEINGKTTPWSSNPWVWVISFKRAS